MKGPEFEATLRTVAALVGQARADVEQTVGTRLPNVEHYAVLARLDALSADIARYVGDVIGWPKQTRSRRADVPK